MTKTFILEGISIDRPFADVFRFMSDRATLPLWTKAFKSVTPKGARYETPAGIVDLGLDVIADHRSGTVDWVMTFPDGAIERAYARIVAEGPTRTNVQFFFAPKLPSEKMAEMVTHFSAVIREEFSLLKSLLEKPETHAHTA
jgi:uncharacterized membrane protein